MYAFEFERPTTIAEAVAALGDEDAQPLSGGQTLIPTLRARLAMPSTLVSLAGIEEMKGIRQEGNTLWIGGASVHADVCEATRSSYPGLSGLVGKIGDPAVRNRGTIGGSIANNDPAACYPAAALASGGTIVTNAREVAADDFFLGMFTTTLEEGEIVTAVKLPIPEASNYQKFEQPASRLPLVGVFVAKHADGVRVAITGASNNGVFRWTEAETALSSNFSADAIEGMKASADDLIADLHGSAAYRAHLIGVLTQRAVEAAS